MTAVLTESIQTAAIEIQDIDEDAWERLSAGVGSDVVAIADCSGGSSCGVAECLCCDCETHGR